VSFEVFDQTTPRKRRKEKIKISQTLFSFYLDGVRGGAVEPAVLRDEQTAVLGHGRAALFSERKNRGDEKES
jgi:hypothetical protein